MPALEIAGLNVRYGSVEAVRGIDLVAAEASITVLLGANGAGKSSVMRACMGLAPKAGGVIRAFGQPIEKLATSAIVRQGMTLSPEGRRVFASLSVSENLSLGAGSEGVRVSRISANMARMFSLFPILGERQHQPAGSLSGGEQQMLAIARALMSEPKILLLDEPSLGLAPIVIDQIFDLIQRLRDEGLTILLVEQNAERALEIGQDAYVMSSGRVVHSGPASKMLAETDLSKAYLGA